MASSIANADRLDVIRCALTGALVALFLFIACWIGTFIPFSSPTHAYIGLFTPAPMSSAEALLAGSCWSLAFGAVIGAFVALVYNGLGRMLGR
jgi:hypothetical protein